jgi:hypothetical protein
MKHRTESKAAESMAEGFEHATSRERLEFDGFPFNTHRTHFFVLTNIANTLPIHSLDDNPIGENSLQVFSHLVDPRLEVFAIFPKKFGRRLNFQGSPERLDRLEGPSDNLCFC